MKSERLTKVGSFVPQGSRMADIGCDHAYLPIDLLEQGVISYAIGCDINKGPLEAARQHVAQSSLNEAQIELRLGNGLLPLSPGEVDVVTIAGMGAGLMVDILDQSPEVVKSVQRFVLSPNVAPWLIRSWAMENGFSIVTETVVEENRRYYEVIVLEPTETLAHYNELELYYGPQLLHDQSAVTTAYFEERRVYDAHVMEKWEEVRARRSDVNEEYLRLERLWKEWEACR